MLVCIGIPCIDGKPYANMVDSLLAEQLLGFGSGVHLYPMWEVGCSLIGVARNKLARRFLDTKEADCIVFVDADISWTGGDLAKLAKSPHDVIGGTYMTKQDGGHFHVRGSPVPDGDLLKVDGLPGGFMKITRAAFERVDAEKYVELSGREMRDYFPTGMHKGQLFGEDYGFCRLYRESGGEIYLDPSIRLRHHDGNRFYAGDVKEWLAGIGA